MSLQNLLRQHLYAQKSTVLDSTTAGSPADDVATNKKNQKSSQDDTAINDASSHEMANIAKDAITAVQQWVETDSDELDKGETVADRLFALLVGAVDSSIDGRDLDDDEQEVYEAILNATWDYLSSLGADDDDISSLLNDWDETAANNIFDLVLAALPDGDDDVNDAVDNFVFGNDQSTAASFDATYAKRTVVRNGQKVRIKKRISGTVHLSPKQKVAIKKMQRKSHSATAKARRLRSMKVHRRAGL